MEYQKTNGAKTANAGAVAILALILYVIKNIFFPFKNTLFFVKDELAQSAKHDFKLLTVSVALAVLVVVLSVVTWITLGAGLVIWLVAGAGPVLTSWFYVLLFELATIIVFATIIAVLNKSLKTPETLNRASKLLKLK